MSKKDFSPVFVIGSPRSGTTLLSRIISSHPEFAVYRAETLLMNVCKPKYGNIFRSERSKYRFLNDWFRSRQYIAANIDRTRFLDILKSSKSYADLLGRFLEAIAFTQNKNRIVDSTPANYFHMEKIKRYCPNAKFINVIRDGRDVAISQVKLGWCNPPLKYTSRSAKLHYSTVQWREVLRSTLNANVRQHTLSLRYEDFIDYPDNYEKIISQFLNLEPGNMDTTIIQDSESSNTAFKSSDPESQKTIARWRSLEPELQAAISYGVEQDLMRNGYEASLHKFNPKLFIRYQIFKWHIKMKRILIQLPFIGRLTSGTLEIIE